MYWTNTKIIVLWKIFTSSDFYSFKNWGYKIVTITYACCKKCQQFINWDKIHLFPSLLHCCSPEIITVKSFLWRLPTFSALKRTFSYTCICVFIQVCLKFFYRDWIMIFIWFLKLHFVLNDLSCTFFISECTDLPHSF